MLAGFRADVKSYKTLVDNINVASDDDIVDMVQFSWGKDAKLME